MKQRSAHSAEEPTAAAQANPQSAEERFLATRSLFLCGVIDSKLVQRLIPQLLLLDHENAQETITLFIHSPGGEVLSGFAIYDTIRFLSAPVRSVVTGVAASMASIIALAPQKERRYCMPQAKFLIHQPLIGGYEGTATDVEIQAREILRDRERIIELYAQRCGGERDQIARDIDRDYWMDAEQARSYGLVDQIIATRRELR